MKNFVIVFVLLLMRSPAFAQNFDCSKLPQSLASGDTNYERIFKERTERIKQPQSDAFSILICGISEYGQKDKRAASHASLGTLDLAATMAMQLMAVSPDYKTEATELLKESYKIAGSKYLKSQPSPTQNEVQLRFSSGISEFASYVLKTLDPSKRPLSFAKEVFLARGIANVFRKSQWRQAYAIVAIDFLNFANELQNYQRFDSSQLRITQEKLAYLISDLEATKEQDSHLLQK